MKKRINDYLLVGLGIFLIWRFFLIIALVYALNNIPLGSMDRYLGGGYINYILSPELFSWANFDGEHYLSIAFFGYKMLEQAFFPIYPFLMSFLSAPFTYDLFSSLIANTIVGIFISNTSFLLALIFLWKLINIDYSKKITLWALLSLAFFPTSFYFGAVYNESLFLLLTVLSFYSARKGKWYLSGILGALSSATRVFGILLLPALLIEAWQQKLPLRKMLWLFLIPLGLIGYMIYQALNFGDPFAFYNLQTVVGEQHQKGIVLLPQVYFRYLKILTSVDFNNPIYQTIILEVFVGVLFFILPIFGYFKKVRWSYLIYAMLGFLIPTIQGSFSSVPRYVIVFFPFFIILSIWITSLPRPIRIILLIASSVFLFKETALFLRGYWIA